MKFSDAHGFSLILILLITVFVAALVFAIMQQVDSELLLFTQESQSMQAYYNARTGAIAVAEWIEMKYDEDKEDEIEDYEKEDSEDVDLDEGKFRISDLKIDDDTYTIKATGRVEEVERDVVIEMEKTSSDDGGKVEEPVNVEEGYEASDSGDVEGGNITIYYDEDPSDYIKFQRLSEEIVDNVEIIIYVDDPGDLSDSEKNDIINEVIEVDHPHASSYDIGNLDRSFKKYPEVPEVPDFDDRPSGLDNKGDKGLKDTINSNDSGRYGDVTIKHPGATVEDDVEIYADSFDVAPNADLDIEDGASLDLYIEDEFNLVSSHKLNSAESDFNIYYYGDDDFDIGTDCEVNANMYIDDSDIEFMDGSEITGNVYTEGENDVLIGANANYNGLFLAPNADIELMGGVDVEGALVSNIIDNPHDTTITFNEDALTGIGEEDDDDGGGSSSGFDKVFKSDN
ncbi:MAG: DUF7305 domain-containing protein [Bacillota bacterium]